MRGPVCGSPRTTMRGPERKGEAFICRYSWIPHQVRNDREGISGFRVAPGHPALDAGSSVWVTPHHDAGSSGVSHPAQRCGVQCESHPAPRCGVQKSASCGYCLCPYFPPGYSWIPHQVRNDRERISGFRVTPGHTAPRCGVQWRGSPRTTMRGPVA